MNLLRFTFIFSLGVLLASATASAAVKWPYKLDPAFAGNGYDQQQGRTDYGVAAQKLALDGNDTIVAVTTQRTDGAGIYGHKGAWIDLLRYGPTGQLKPWTGASGSPTRLSMGYWSGGHRYEAIRDVAVSDAGDIYLLIDNRPEGFPDTDSVLLQFSSNGSFTGSAVVAATRGNTNDNGAQLIIAGNRLFALVSQHQLPADDPNVITYGTSVQVRAFSLQSNANPSPDNTWGTGGTNSRTYSYNHCGLVDPGDPPPSQPCELRGTHLTRAPDGSLYIAGATFPSWGSATKEETFLLKLNANGTVVSSHGVNGWVVRGVADTHAEPAALVTRITGMIVLPGPVFSFTYDVFMLAALQRTCGEGAMVFNFKSNGDYVARTWTYGGGGVGGDPLCDSVKARDMVMVPDGPLGSGGGQLAIVGQYLSKPVVQNAPQGHTAILLTVDPNNLPNTQSTQRLLGGGAEPYDPRYGFRAVNYNSSTKRLLAVGDYEQDWQYDTDYMALTARLKIKPLFADGFEN